MQVEMERQQSETEELGISVRLLFDGKDISLDVMGNGKKNGKRLH